MILMPLLLASFAVPLAAKFSGVFYGRELIKPTWNDNPITLKRPLSFFHFLSFYFLVAGLSMVAGTGIEFRSISFFGLASVSFGVGMLTGIWLTLKLAKAKV